MSGISFQQSVINKQPELIVITGLALTVKLAFSLVFSKVNTLLTADN